MSGRDRTDTNGMSNAAPAAGWFADPHDPSRLRWWDGATWTAHVHPPIVEAPVAPVTPVTQAAPVNQAAPASRVEARQLPEEKVLVEYYGNEKEPSMFGFNFKFRARVSFGSGRSPHGKATISELLGEMPPYDEAAERAELAASGLDAEQIESTIRIQTKVASLIEQAEGNPVACKLAHGVLRKLAFSTARGRRSEAMNIVFDGRRYQAYGGTLNR